ncbi:hypothetical protein Taro_015513 [Colocasia esculenta]|uniref:Uncharacterized protein n=1 Tax=Colocasia esculenta TaxID=4460 RepID=A0A843UTE2_COLES|nr:hypothetical protein [Colocasia esculenta]
MDRSIHSRFCRSGGFKFKFGLCPPDRPLIRLNRWIPVRSDPIRGSTQGCSPFPPAPPACSSTAAGLLLLLLLFFFFLLSSFSSSTLFPLKLERDCQFLEDCFFCKFLRWSDATELI